MPSRRLPATLQLHYVVVLLALGLATQLLATVGEMTEGRVAVGSAQSRGIAGRRGRGRGRARQYVVLSGKAPCVTLERRYVSSPLEQTWFDAAAKWKTDGNGNLQDVTPFCTLLVNTRPQIEKMLDYIKQLMASNTTLSDQPDADAVLSYFVTTMQCGPYTVTHKEHIESLVAALRHPFSTKCPADFSSQLPPPTDIFDKGYVLLAAWAGQVQAARNRYYLDAGAGIGYLANSNQHWMIESYAARGITLDRALFWESRTATGEELLRDVPDSLFPAFAFYNMAVPRDLADGRNILNIVTRLARPDDFVSIKLDIDRPEIEDEWLRAILGQQGPTGQDGPVGQSLQQQRQQPSRYAALIDELFWEHHFNFAPMVKCCWRASIDPKSYLADSMRMFVQLRQLGIRSHYWQ